MNAFFKIMFVIVMVFSIAELGASLNYIKETNKKDLDFFSLICLVSIGFVLVYGIYHYGAIN